MNTIHEAKQHLRDNFKKGVDCPCCGQLVRMYNRKLNTGMCRFLIALHLYTKRNNTDYASSSDVITSIGSGTKSLDFSILKYWGIIETKPDQEKDTRGSGMWRITEKGYDFLYCRTIVPSHVMLYNNRLIGFSDTMTDINTALGKKFSYRELMGYDY